MKQEYIQGQFLCFYHPGIGVGIGRFVDISDDLYYLEEVYLSEYFFVGYYIHKKRIMGTAIPVQIEKRLIVYAKKNGYIGSKVRLICGAIGNISEEIKYLEFRYNDIVGRNGCNVYTIYHQGQWAEIVAHAPSVQDKQDEALTERIHEYLTDQDLEKMSIMINGYSVSLLKCVDVYRKCLEVKEIMG